MMERYAIAWCLLLIAVPVILGLACFLMRPQSARTNRQLRLFSVSIIITPIVLVWQAMFWPWVVVSAESTPYRILVIWRYEILQNLVSAAIWVGPIMFLLSIVPVWVMKKRLQFNDLFLGFNIALIVALGSTFLMLPHGAN